MHSIEIQVDSESYTNDVFLNNGFTRYDCAGRWYHDAFVGAGIRTSPGNSEAIFEKEGILYLFDGWEADQYGRVVRPARYLKAIDVTEIIKNS